MISTYTLSGTCIILYMGLMACGSDADPSSSSGTGGTKDGTGGTAPDGGKAGAGGSPDTRTKPCLSTGESCDPDYINERCWGYSCECKDDSESTPANVHVFKCDEKTRRCLGGDEVCKSICTESGVSKTYPEFTCETSRD